MRRLLPVVALLLTASPAAAQDADFREDLSFAEALRARGDNDLALELLLRLQKAATAEQRKELSLELAKTRLLDAAGMPEAARRLARYREARADFEKFIADNPGHPRVPEAYLDIARTLDLQGKTELNRALITDSPDERKRLSAQARALLVEAGDRLAKAADEQQARLAKLPDPETIDDAAKKRAAALARFRAEGELKQAQLDRALGYYDQSRTYLTGAGDKQAIALLDKARDILDKLANGPPAQPITWKARAWQSRVLLETEGAPRARAKLNQVLSTTSAAAAEGVRLARYFKMLVVRAAPEPAEAKKVNSILIEAATRWRADYPRHRATPEGFGVAFLLAQAYLAEADVKRDVFRNRQLARALLREVESSENELTERAFRLKIATIEKLGLFKTKIAELTRFEDCYVRAQYEAWRMYQELEKAKTPKEAEEKRKGRLGAILEALRRGLALPEAKKLAGSLEVNNARAMLAYWAWRADRLDEAIKVGEGFARDDPRSGQAEKAAAYALRAYFQRLNGKLAKGEKAGDDRDRMMALAGYMTQRWPAGPGGDTGRHFLGLQLLREGRFAEAIKQLSLVSDTHEDFALACFHLADAALKADRAGADPIIGDRPGDYRKRAVEALERMPEAALGPAPQVNAVLIHAKGLLGRQLFGLKRFAEMEELATRLEARLPGLTFDSDAKKNEAMRKQLGFELVDVRLLAKYGQADAAEQAGDHAQAARALDGLIDRLNGKEATPERELLRRDERKQLARLTLRMALRANMNLGNVKRTDAVLDALEKVSGESEDASAALLRELAGLIVRQLEELRKKGDKAEEEKAVKGYAAILDQRVKKVKSPTTDFKRVLAACYSNMGRHAEAAALLAKVPAPKGARPGSDEDRLHKAVQLALARELRLSGTADSLKKARGMIDGFLGDAKKPGWGFRDLGALMENAHLLGAEGKWGEAFAVWSRLQSDLKKRVNQGGAVLERYLECYFYMVHTYLRMGMAKASQPERDKYVRTAAQQVANLEASWEDFGTDASRRRFTELFAKEPALKAAYEALKAKQKK